MARYEHLPIYKSIYELNLYFFRLAKGFPKDYKYGLAVQVEEILNKLMDVVIEANNCQAKSAILKEGLVLIEKLKIKARMLNDLKVMNLKSYKYFFVQLVEVSKQLEKWQSWSEAH